MRPVELTKEGPSRSNKVRVRWLDGEYEGLEEWVPKIRLVAPWDEADTLLHDEFRMLKAVEVSEDAFDKMIWEAAGEVLGALSERSTSQEEVFFGNKAAEEKLLVVQDLKAAALRLGLDEEKMLAEPHAFVDRSGWYKAPFRTAVKVAKHCCQRFPREVLKRIRKEENESRRELISGGPAPSYPWWMDSAPYRERAEARLEEMKPVHNLIRKWCGQEDPEEFKQIFALREEVDRLRKLAQETVGWLKDSGHPVKAGLLRRELDDIPRSD